MKTKIAKKETTIKYITAVSLMGLWLMITLILDLVIYQKNDFPVSFILFTLIGIGFTWSCLLAFLTIKKFSQKTSTTEKKELKDTINVVAFTLLPIWGSIYFTHKYDNYIALSLLIGMIIFIIGVIIGLHKKSLTWIIGTGILVAVITLTSSFLI